MTSRIDSTEREDFLTVLKENGLAEADFELSATTHPLPSQGIAPVRGEVTVRHTRSGVTRHYESGHGTAWVMEFERDLKAGAYR